MKLSPFQYIWKCVLGGELLYAICVTYGFIIRTGEDALLHNRLFELVFQGAKWGTFTGIALGFLYVLIASILVGTYMVWMYNSSLRIDKPGNPGKCC